MHEPSQVREVRRLIKSVFLKGTGPGFEFQPVVRDNRLKVLGGRIMRSVIPKIAIRIQKVLKCDPKSTKMRHSEKY